MTNQMAAFVTSILLVVSLNASNKTGTQVGVCLDAGTIRGREQNKGLVHFHVCVHVAL